MKPLDYVLEADGRTPRPEPDQRAWKRQRDELMGCDGHVVAKDVVGEVVVSTVFLFTDMGAEELPVLWETGLFKHAGEGRLGKFIEVVDRYGSWEAAKAGHHQLVAGLRKHAAR